MLTFATFALLLALAVVSAVGYLRTKDALEVAQSANSIRREFARATNRRIASCRSTTTSREKNLQVALERV